MNNGPDHALVPPHSLAAEQAVIAGMMLSSEAVVEALDILTPNDFYANQHKWLYITMVQLHKKGLPIDIVTVTAEVAGIAPNGIDSVGGTEYVAQLVSSIPTTLYTKHYANIVLKKAMLRNMIDACRGIMEECYTEENEVDEILHEAEKRILRLSQSRKARNFTHISEPAATVYQRIADRTNGVAEDQGMMTGFTEIDKITTGLQKSDLIIVAARPSVGKTAFALNLAQNAAVRSNAPVAIFSLEMSKEQLVQRMMAAETNVSGLKLRTGALDDMDWLNMSWGMSRLINSPVYIDDTPGVNIFEMRSKLRRMKVETGLGMVVIDYLQLIQGRKTENRLQEVSEISRMLKQIARELEVPVVALSQLSRSVEQRADKRPILSDLRESGAIEQDADIISFLYRDDYYDRESQSDEIEVIIAKQRNGPLGTVKLKFLKEFNKFVDLEAVAAVG